MRTSKKRRGLHVRKCTVKDTTFTVEPWKVTEARRRKRLEERLRDIAALKPKPKLQIPQDLLWQAAVILGVSCSTVERAIESVHNAQGAEDGVSKRPQANI